MGDALAPPEPGSVPVCLACESRRFVVIANLTAELRQAGHPYTVLGPCPICAPTPQVISPS